MPKKYKPTLQLADEPGKALDNEDVDIVNERREAQPVANDPSGIRITGMQKRYDAGFNSIVTWIGETFAIAPQKLKSALPFYADRPAAIQELSLVVNRGSLLSLLGSNGGTKSFLNL